MTFIEFESIWSLVVSANIMISLITTVNAFGIEFTLQQTIFTNKMFCALENPDLVLNNVRYKQECILLCQGDSTCANVNWKAPSTCEMYFYYAAVFGEVENCVYFGKGEILDFNKQRSTISTLSKAPYYQRYRVIQVVSSVCKKYMLKVNFSNSSAFCTRLMNSTIVYLPSM